jgi:two-component system KDP operon response regulator KdpE
LGEKEIHLTPTEYSLLRAMIRRAGRVVTHGVLVQEVWGPQDTKDIHTLRVFMRQLRYKVEPEPAQPKYLITVPGVGYRLKTNV